MSKIFQYNSIFSLKRDIWLKYFKMSLFFQIVGVMFLYFLDERSYVYLQVMQIFPLFAAYDTLRCDLKSVASEMIVVECIMATFFALILFFDGFGYVYLIIYVVLFLLIPLVVYISFKLLLES